MEYFFNPTKKTRLNSKKIDNNNEKNYTYNLNKDK